MDSAAFPSLNHIDVAKRLNEKFGLTVLIDNDLHVATNVARKYSNYKEGITVLYAYGKRKSGSGIIANGEVLCGASALPARSKTSRCTLRTLNPSA